MKLETHFLNICVKLKKGVTPNSSSLTNGLLTFELLDTVFARPCLSSSEESVELHCSKYQLAVAAGAENRQDVSIS